MARASFAGLLYHGRRPSTWCGVRSTCSSPGLCLADFVRHTNGRWSRFVPKGVLIGIAAGIKLTPAIFIPYLLMTRQWRMAVSAIAGFAGTVIIGGIMFPAMSVTYWFSNVWQLSSKVDLGTQFASAGNNSIQGAAGAIGHWAVSPSKVIVIVVAVLGLLAAARDLPRGTNAGGGSDCRNDCERNDQGRSCALRSRTSPLAAAIRSQRRLRRSAKPRSRHSALLKSGAGRFRREVSTSYG